MRSAVLLLLAACGGEMVPTPAPSAEEILRAELTADMRAGGIPGAAYAIVTGEGVLLEGALGEADVENRVAVGAGTLFIIASISKTIAGVPILQLAEEGRLDLDAPLEDHLPYRVRHPDHPDTPISARMLLTHTGGLRDDWIRLGAATGAGDSRITLREFSEGYVTPGGRFYGDNWGAAPGTRRSYTNAAFGVLGDLFETVAGEPLPAWSARRVFGPLGMRDTGWHLADVEEARVAVPYAGTWEEGFTRGRHQGFGFYPATSIRTTIGDLSRFLRAMIRGGELDGARILSTPTMEAVGTPQRPDLSPTQGLVWDWESVNGRRYLGHSGSTVGGSALALYSAERGLGILLLTNSDAFIRARFGKREGSEAFARMVDRLERFASR